MIVIGYIMSFCFGIVATMLYDNITSKFNRHRAYVNRLERTVASQRRSLEFYRHQAEIKK